MCLKEIGLSKNAHHSRLNSQHDWGVDYMTLMNMRIFISTKHKIGKWLRAQLGFANYLGTNCHFHIIQEAGAERKVSK